MTLPGFQANLHASVALRTVMYPGRFKSYKNHLHKLGYWKVPVNKKKKKKNSTTLNNKYRQLNANTRAGETKFLAARRMAG